ncbi:MAG TPA: tyrosine-protein phosphatase [Gaiellaceae bacterium]|nr:tyrosine-protein phosphatase [Gaiellaceae bacterium]
MQVRNLTWDGCVNVRDLGGLPTQDGGQTAYGRVVRADDIGALSASGRRALLAYGVRRIVDLRWPAERAERPPLQLDVEIVHIPVFGDQNERHDEDRRLLEHIPDHVECRRVMYLEHLAAYRERFAAAVAAVASAHDGCVLVHCAGGVDRTGLVAALLLRLADVPNDVVAADFALSKANWAPYAQDWIADAEDERERAFRRFLSAMPGESMRGVLVELERSYRGAEGYLRGGGLSEHDVRFVRARLRP